MKNVIGVITSILLFTMSMTSYAEKLPDGAIQKGSLSNQKLIQDTMLGVAQKVSALGCQKPESFLPYILAMPQGKPGSRYWRELWVVKGCGTEYPVKITFRESGLSAADYVIEN